ncbi:phosphatidate cytidylyltransferase [Luteolibacter marinus]|uniref:phosphatidate cytidylyltransferase n=1 Tax=Luteolibacter marinus TaxID=2776705 RepID=UPI001865F4EA|nr:phosphatidate cytidylyltransferase [Luteolibacter marinus]
MNLDPAAIWTALGVTALLAVATLCVAILDRLGKITRQSRKELYQRIRTWAILAPLLILPFVLGPLAIKAGSGILGLLCFREFSRATGLFRERAISITSSLSIILLTLVSLSGWPQLWMAAPPLLSLAIVIAGVFQDRPEGYLQRVSLGVLGFFLFGICFAHLGLLADRLPDGRIFLWLLLCVALNDVAAYLTGRLWGRRKLCPNTSPNKTVAGAVGGVLCTSLLSVAAGKALALPIPSIPLLLLAGAICSAAGTIGDLVISSVKRDLHIKDMSAALPGHGGILDRFDSLVPAAPCTFYFLLAFVLA